jgi:ribosomal protein S18 acetylase RimI-like enzyme
MGSTMRSRAREDRSSNLPRWFPDPEIRAMSEATPPDLAVRDADAADASAVAAIGRLAVPETYADLINDVSVMKAIVEQSYALSALRDCIAHCARDEGAHFLVAERRGRIVGFLHYDSEGPEPELHRIYLDPQHKRQGIGSALVRELHRRLPQGTTYILMVVAANHPAVSFYEHHGFVEDTRVDGVAYMHETMGVDFPPGTPEVPALILRFTKRG